jgi:hypothetical protein
MDSDYRSCAPHGIPVAFGRTVVCSHPQVRCDWDDCDRESLPNAYTCGHHTLAAALDYLVEREGAFTLAAVAALAAVGGVSMGTNPTTQISTVVVNVPGAPTTTYSGLPLEDVWTILERALVHMTSTEGGDSQC